jgi:hypothetical protein
MGAFECVRKVYQTDGLKGFYRGMSASYAGISETVIHFVIYESIKQKLLECKTATVMESEDESVKEASDFVRMMLAAATSKTCATTIAYPHGKNTTALPCTRVDSASRDMGTFTGFKVTKHHSWELKSSGAWDITRIALIFKWETAKRCKSPVSCLRSHQWWSLN